MITSALVLKGQMRSVLCGALCLLVANVSAQQPNEAAVFVSSRVPIYVNGKALAPRDGGHRVSLGRVNGIVVDGFVYLPVTKSPPFVPTVKADGMHYAQHVAMVAADEKLAAGGGRDAARQSMIDAWGREFGRELTWVVDPADKYQFILNYHGQSLVVAVPCAADYRPQEQAKDNFQSLHVHFEELIRHLRSGALVLCGRTYLQVIDSDDAANVIKEIEALPAQPRVLRMVGSEVVFEKISMAGGKYTLTNAVIRDLVAQQ